MDQGEVDYVLPSLAIDKINNKAYEILLELVDTSMVVLFRKNEGRIGIVGRNVVLP